MENYKILATVRLAVLCFLVRESQSRSLESDESANNIERVGNIEDWNTNKCICFPMTNTGTPVSKYFPNYNNEERLVVYLYRNRQSNELRAYIPNSNKQGHFPDLTFDVDDKLESIGTEGIVDLFGSAYFAKHSEGVGIYPSALLKDPEEPTIPDPYEIAGVSANTLVRGPLDELTIPGGTNQTITNVRRKVEPPPVETTTVQTVLTPMKSNLKLEQNQEKGPPEELTIPDPSHKITDVSPNTYSVRFPPDELTIPNGTHQTMTNVRPKIEPPPTETTIVQTTLTPMKQNLKSEQNEEEDSSEELTISGLTIPDGADKTMTDVRPKVEHPPVETTKIYTVHNPIHHNLKPWQYHPPGMKTKVKPPLVETTISDTIHNPIYQYQKPWQYYITGEKPKVKPASVETAIIDTIYNPIHPNLKPWQYHTTGMNPKVNPPLLETTIIDATPNPNNPNSKPSQYHTTGMKPKVKRPPLETTIIESIPNPINSNPKTWQYQNHLSRLLPDMSYKIPNTLLIGPPNELNIPIGTYQPIVEPPPYQIENTKIPNQNPNQQNQNKQTPFLPDGLYTHQFPGKPGAEVETIHTNPSWIDKNNPNRPTDSVNVGYLKIYEHPIFNDWFNKQMKIIRSNRSSVSNAINFHSLKLVLIKALYDNGIYLSREGDLYDSNGNIFKVSNLKLRPILMGDPTDYEKLIRTTKCVTPSDLSHLEAVFVTSSDPPRILAIVPLGLRKLFISNSQGITPKLCGHSNHVDHSFRSGLPEKEESTSDLNNKSDDISGEQVMDSIDSNNVASKNDYPFMTDNNAVSMQTSQPTFDSLYKENDENKHNLQVGPGETVTERNNKYLDDGNHIEERKKDLDIPQEPSKQPIDEDYVTLNMRIVGGNPATSSGTPVSSRGRSGLDP